MRIEESNRQYLRYKLSGVPWLGDVPAHWEVLSGRACYTSEQILNKGLPEHTVLSLSYGRIKVRPEEKLHGLVPASFETYQIIEPDDIVCRPTDLQNDWNSLRFGLSQQRGIITAAYMCIRTSSNLTRCYGYLLLHTYDLKKVFYGLGSGLRQNLRWTDFKLLPCLVPPLPEQAAIVRYLDHVDRRIRRYVAAKRRLIALLEEEKQAIVNQAVTRGLEPNVRLKPSGVEWLGDVPEHWAVMKLARLVHSSNAGEVIDKGWWGRGTEVLYTCARQAVPSDYASFPLAKRTTGLDLLLTRNGTPYVHRPVANAIYSNVVQRINLAAGTDREWIALTLEASARGMKGYGVSIESLNYDMWKVLVVLAPPEDEQTAIVEHLHKATAATDAATTRARRQIELVEEYRTRLIADVVTGKLDVRAAAAQLPDEADGGDPTDEGESVGYGRAEPAPSPAASTPTPF